MPELTITVSVEQDGALLANYPMIRRVQFPEVQGIANEKAGGDSSGVYVSIPGVNVSPAINAFVLSTDQALNVRFGGVAANDGIIPLQANGLIVIIGADIASGATTNAEVNNTGSNAANLKGLAAGT